MAKKIQSFARVCRLLCTTVPIYFIRNICTPTLVLIYWLTEMKPDVLFCCCSPPTPRFKVLSMLRSFSAFSGSLNQSGCFTSDLVVCPLTELSLIQFFFYCEIPRKRVSQTKPAHLAPTPMPCSKS